MPTRRELADRGLGGAWSAMQRHGGVAAWRERLTAPRPTREDIATRAYFLAQERAGAPFDTWLAAERELPAA
jgi:hypothetical protein